MTALDKERIASLHKHLGFQALLQVLDEADELLLDKIESAITKDEEAKQLSLWRGTRRVKKILRSVPAEYYELMGGSVDPF